MPVPENEDVYKRQMYDFAHPIGDALEGITHSLCSLEFEAHRPLYNWVIEHCELPCLLYTSRCV